MFEVYIHVPFCLRRCGYCDFNTYTATDLGAGASRGNYANMVIREMKLTKQWQLDHGIAEPPVSTVFFGGGTPTILAARDLVAMLDAVRKIWGIAPDAEITTEANPLMRYVNNANGRMPVILRSDDESRWLSPALSDAQIAALLKPYPEQELHSEPVRCDFMHEVAADPGILVPA